MHASTSDLIPFKKKKKNCQPEILAPDTPGGYHDVHLVSSSREPEYFKKWGMRCASLALGKMIGW